MGLFKWVLYKIIVSPIIFQLDYVLYGDILSGEWVYSETR